jgi:hypothetical protein
MSDTDTSDTIPVCAACGRSTVEVVSSPTGTTDVPAWKCAHADCGARFDEPDRRAPKRDANRYGLARKLSDMSPPEGTHD